MKHFYSLSGILAIVLFLTSIAGAQTISTFPYLEDFENGNGGWTPGGVGSWALGTPAKPTINSAASGTNAWVTGGLTGLYIPNANSFVESPEFDFTSLQQPIIQLNIWWNSEFSWDGAVLQSSTNGGASWQNIGSFGDPNNWYNDNTINGNPGGQQEGWTGQGGNGSGGWVVAKNDMNSLIGQSSVKLRIAFGSDASVQGEGFAFDDILIFDLKAKDLGLLDVISPRQDCGLGQENVTIRFRNFGFQPQSGFGLTYRINNQAPVTEIFSGTINQDQEVTYTFNQQANLLPDSNYIISAWVDLFGDENTVNDSIFNIGLKTVLPIAPVAFDGYNGLNLSEALPGWREASGLNPAGDNSNWTVSDSIQSNFFGVTTAKVNLSGISQREWLIGPIFRVPRASIMYFNAATTVKDGTATSAMGSDDQLDVMLSDDCGSSWTSVLTLDAANGLDNTLRQYAVRLDNYVGQEIILAFRAQDGPSNDPEDYDLHVTNFEARFIYPNDAGILKFRTDNGTDSIPANSGTNVFITLKNFGANTISNIPILATMGNVNYQYVRYNPVTPNREIEINLGGYYGAVQGLAKVPFKAFTMFPNDTINSNDTLNTFLKVTGAVGVGLETDASEKLSVFPNPSHSGEFVISSETTLRGHVEITNADGSIVHRGEINSKLTSLNISELPKGIYFLKYDDGNERIVKKLIYR